MKLTKLLNIAALLLLNASANSASAAGTSFVEDEIRLDSTLKQSEAETVPISFTGFLTESPSDLCTAPCDNTCDLACDSNICDGACDSFFSKRSDYGLLGYGIIKKSDVCFNDFISPMTNPVFFEDPRNLTEARAIFLNHQLPNALGGNSVQVYALQIRAAITERLSIIATKDGLIYSQSPVVQSGFADIAAGLKYNLFRDTENGRLLSIGGTFEIPTGTARSLQGNGDGLFNFFATAGTRVGKSGHWLTAAGLLQPVDELAENRIFFWSNHLDKRLSRSNVYIFTEANWFNYLSSGNGIPVEGGDLFDLGSSNVTGNNLVTGAMGTKWKPRSNIETGLAYEVPLTEREGVLANRFTADFILRY